MHSMSSALEPRMSKRRSICLRTGVFCATFTGLILVVQGLAAAQVPAWVAQGPAPNTQGQVENIAGNEVIGAIRVIAPHPTDANVVYVGAVNGGIWRTATAMAASPNWEHQTDDKQSLSVGALEFDPTDATHQTLVAGMGRFSSLSEYGGALTGLLRTTNGGAVWNVIDGGGALQGLNVSGVVPRGSVITISVNEADNPQNVGIWRSTNTGSTWAKVSGTTGTGLPDGPSACLASDSSKPDQIFTNAGSSGLYRSSDAGATWSKISSTEMDAAISQADNLKISIASRSSVYVVYVAVDVGGHLAAIFRSENNGSSWTGMDVPNGPEGGIHPGGQGGVHLSLAADPFDPNVVYVGGDRQPAKFISGEESYNPPQWPNSIGAMDYSGRLFRGNASKPRGNQWVHLTHSRTLGSAGAGTAHGSAPHADSRGMIVASNGTLIEVDDGGIYRRTAPQTNAGDWFSMNGDLQVTEFHAVAWDANCHTVVGGAQDTGTPEQHSLSGMLWQSVSKGDGGVVAVDSVSTPGRSIRYSSYYDLGSFRRQIYNSANVFQSESYPPLRIVGGGADLEPQFYTPVKLNEVMPARLIIGAKNSVYESPDQGDTIREIGRGIRTNGTGPNPLAYGAKGNPDILYVGSGNRVFVRTGPYPNPLLPSNSYSGDTVFGIALNPNKGETAYVVSPTGVYQTTTAGSSWIEITGNLVALDSGTLRSICYSTAEPKGAVLIGTDRGVFIAAGPTFSSWTRLGAGLPNAPVYHIEYVAAEGIVLAGTLGRGAWTFKMAAGTSPATETNLQASAKAHTEPSLAARVVATRKRPQIASQTPSSHASGNADTFELTTGVIADTAGGRLYAMDPQHGVEALDLVTGKRMWMTKAAAKPIGWAGGRLIAQAEASEEPNKLTIVAISSTTGEGIVTGGVTLPSDVRASVTESLKGNFKAVAGMADGDTVVSWQFTRHHPKALPPGTRSTLPATGPAAATVPNQSDRGTFRMNLTTGAVSTINAKDAAPVARLLMEEHLAPTEPDVPDTESPSADGRHVLVSTRTGDDTEFEKYTLTVYERETKARVGEFKSHVSLVPFFVWKSEVIYESSPYALRTGDGVRQEPRKIRAVDLNSGKEIWSAEIRDVKYRGPFPP